MSAVDDLLSSYQHVIESVTLIMGSKGIFDVTVDGEILYSKHAVGRHAHPGEVLERFANTYGNGVARYGS